MSACDLVEILDYNMCKGSRRYIALMLDPGSLDLYAIEVIMTNDYPLQVVVRGITESYSATFRCGECLSAVISSRKTTITLFPEEACDTVLSLAEELLKRGILVKYAIFEGVQECNVPSS